MHHRQQLNGGGDRRLEGPILTDGNELAPKAWKRAQAAPVPCWKPCHHCLVEIEKIQARNGEFHEPGLKRVGLYQNLEEAGACWRHSDNVALHSASVPAASESGRFQAGVPIGLFSACKGRGSGRGKGAMESRVGVAMQLDACASPALARSTWYFNLHFTFDPCQTTSGTQKQNPLSHSAMLADSQKYRDEC